MSAIKDWRVVGLFFIAVISTALLFQSGQTGEESPDRHLWAGFKSVVAQADMVELTSKGASVTIIREEQGWQVRERDNYPADFLRLSGFLKQLADLEWQEKKTARPENHERLGVGESATRVLVHSGGQTFQMLVGKAADTLGSFVRLAGEDQVYLTGEVLDVPMDPQDWLDPVVINVESSTVNRVVLQGSGGKVEAVRDDTGNLELLDIPAGRKPRYDTIADSLGRLLVNVRFEDVATYDAGRFSGPSVASVMLDGGENIIARTISGDDGNWLHVDRDGLRNWQFRISDTTYREFNKSMADFLEAESSDE